MHGSYRGRWRTCLLFDSIWSVFQTLVTHDWVSEGQWRADASVHMYWGWFWYFKEKKRKTLLLASLYVFITQCNKLYFQYSCHCYLSEGLFPLLLAKTWTNKTSFTVYSQHLCDITKRDLTDLSQVSKKCNESRERAFIFQLKAAHSFANCPTRCVFVCTSYCLTICVRRGLSRPTGSQRESDGQSKLLTFVRFPPMVR